MYLKERRERASWETGTDNLFGSLWGQTAATSGLTLTLVWPGKERGRERGVRVLYDKLCNGHTFLSDNYCSWHHICTYLKWDPQTYSDYWHIHSTKCFDDAIAFCLFSKGKIIAYLNALSVHCNDIILSEKITSSLPGPFLPPQPIELKPISFFSIGPASSRKRLLLPSVGWSVTDALWWLVSTAHLSVRPTMRRIQRWRWLAGNLVLTCIDDLHFCRNTFKIHDIHSWI